MLELYQAEDCPHSQNVREKLTELGLSYVSHNPRLAEGEGADGDAIAGRAPSSLARRLLYMGATLYCVVC